MDDLIASIPDFARQHVQTVREVFEHELDFSEDSIFALDGIIARGWPDGPPALLESTVLTFGSYLGEAIRRNLGGEWVTDEEGNICLEKVGGRLKIFPFNKVLKRFHNGDEDSLALYYKAIRELVVVH